MDKLWNINGTNVKPETKISYIKENPKRKNSAANSRFGKYMKSTTVEQFFKLGGTLADLRYDQTKEFVKLV